MLRFRLYDFWRERIRNSFAPTPKGREPAPFSPSPFPRSCAHVALLLVAIPLSHVQVLSTAIPSSSYNFHVLGGFSTSLLFIHFSIKSMPVLSGAGYPALAGRLENGSPTCFISPVNGA